MLLKDFYKILSLDKTDAGKYLAVVVINEKHEIFKGHFPGNPVLPGVCMMQIIKELTEQATGQKLMMQTLSSAKFMAIVNPFVTPRLNVELDITATDDRLVKVKNVTLFDETVALKFSAVYKII